ncbi:MAG: hypothetical protein HWE30_03730 [Methylocystaceae bacterium]|nr:hypothetical protein [Methylocystaceae bacterium]
MRYLFSLYVFILAFTLAFSVPQVQAQEEVGKSVATEVVVNPNKWTVGRLRNVGDRTKIEMGVASDGDVVFLLLKEEEFKKFPKVKAPTALITVHQRLSLSTIIKEAGNYYLLFWNKGQQDPVRVKFFAHVKPVE